MYHHLWVSRYVALMGFVSMAFRDFCLNRSQLTPTQEQLFSCLRQGLVLGYISGRVSNIGMLNLLSIFLNKVRI